MSLNDHTVESIELIKITTRYPRTIGRNARLGSHGDGPISDAVIIRTDTGRAGWGLIAGRAADPDTVVGRPVGELLDERVGVPDEHRWLDFALHDLAGVLLDQPVYAMLGAAGSRTVPCYDGAIYFADLDPDDAPRGIDAVLADCAADTELGFTDFKLKIGRGNKWLQRAAGDERDIAITRAVRSAYPRARILVDANDGYDLDGFLRYLDGVADCGLYWIEEPFGDNGADLAALRARLDQVSPETLIADGESNPDVDQLLEIAGDKAIDVLLMDTVSFGLTAWRRLMPTVAKTGAQASPHAWGLPLKTLYTAQLAAGLGNVPIVEAVPGTTVGVDTSQYALADGRITVPDLPGFGIPVPARSSSGAS